MILFNMLIALRVLVPDDDLVAQLRRAREGLAAVAIDRTELTSALGLIRKATDVDHDRVINSLEESPHLFEAKRVPDDPDLTVYPYYNPLATLELTLEPKTADPEPGTRFTAYWRDRLNRLHKVAFEVTPASGTVRLEQGSRLGAEIRAPVSITFFHRVCFQVRPHDLGLCVVIGNGPEAYQYVVTRDRFTGSAVSPESIERIAPQFHHILALTDDTLLELRPGTKPGPNLAASNFEDRLFIDHCDYLGDLQGIRPETEWLRGLFCNVRSFVARDVPIEAEPGREAVAAEARNEAVRQLRGELRRIEVAVARQRIKVLELKADEATALLPLRRASQSSLIDTDEFARELSNQPGNSE